MLPIQLCYFPVLTRALSRRWSFHIDTVEAHPSSHRMPARRPGPASHQDCFDLRQRVNLLVACASAICRWSGSCVYKNMRCTTFTCVLVLANARLASPQDPSIGPVAPLDLHALPGLGVRNGLICVSTRTGKAFKAKPRTSVQAPCCSPVFGVLNHMRDLVQLLHTCKIHLSNGLDVDIKVPIQFVEPCRS